METLFNIIFSQKVCFANHYWVACIILLNLIMNYWSKLKEHIFQVSRKKTKLEIEGNLFKTNLQ